MTESIPTAAPASSWGSTFASILNTVVDTGAKVAIAKYDAKQAENDAEQKAALTIAEANAAAAKSATASSNTNAANWQKLALIAGAAVLAVGVLVLVTRKR